MPSLHLSSSSIMIEKNVSKEDQLKNVVINAQLSDFSPFFQIHTHSKRDPAAPMVHRVACSRINENALSR